MTLQEQHRIRNSKSDETSVNTTNLATPTACEMVSLISTKAVVVQDIARRVIAYMWGELMKINQ